MLAGTFRQVPVELNTANLLFSAFHTKRAGLLLWLAPWRAAGRATPALGQVERNAVESKQGKTNRADPFVTPPWSKIHLSNALVGVQTCLGTPHEIGFPSSGRTCVCGLAHFPDGGFNFINHNPTFKKCLEYASHQKFNPFSSVFCSSMQLFLFWCFVKERSPAPAVVWRWAGSVAPVVGGNPCFRSGLCLTSRDGDWRICCRVWVAFFPLGTFFCIMVCGGGSASTQDARSLVTKQCVAEPATLTTH